MFNTGSRVSLSGKRICILSLLLYTGILLGIGINYIADSDKYIDRDIEIEIHKNSQCEARGFREDWYIPISVPNTVEYGLQDYQLYRINCGASPSSNTNIILFIPGHRGSYLQVSTVASMYCSLYPNDFTAYSVDFNQEMNSFSTENLYKQSYYIDAVLRYIHLTHPSSEIYCIAHSNGGIIAKLALMKHFYYTSQYYNNPYQSIIQSNTVDNYVGYFRVLITLNTPHRSLPIYFTSSMYSTFRRINNFYSNLYANNNNNNDIGVSNFYNNFHLVSIASGHSDTLIRSDLAILDGIFPNNQSIFVYTNTIPSLTDLDSNHNSIVACDRLAHTILDSFHRVSHRNLTGPNTVYKLLMSEYVDNTAEKLYLTSHSHPLSPIAISFDDDSRYIEDLSRNIDNDIGNSPTIAQYNKYNINIPQISLESAQLHQEKHISYELSRSSSSSYLFQFGPQLFLNNIRGQSDNSIEARIVNLISNININTIEGVYLCRSIKNNQCILSKNILDHIILIPVTPAYNTNIPRLLLQIQKQDITEHTHLFLRIKPEFLDSSIISYILISQSLNIKSESSYNGFLSHSYIISRTIFDSLPLNLKSIHPIPIQVSIQNTGAHDNSHCINTFSPILYYISLPTREQEWRIKNQNNNNNNKPQTINYDIHLHQSPLIQTQLGGIIIDPRCTYSVTISTDWTARWGINFRGFARLLFPAQIALLLLLITIQLQTRRTALKLLTSYIYHLPLGILFYSLYISLVNSIYGSINITYSPSFWTVFSLYLCSSGLIILGERFLTIWLRIWAALFVALYNRLPHSVAFLFGRMLFGRIEKEPKLGEDTEALLKETAGNRINTGLTRLQQNNNCNNNNNNINSSPGQGIISPVTSSPLHHSYRYDSSSRGIISRSNSYVSTRIWHLGLFLLSIHESVHSLFTLLLILIWVINPYLSLFIGCVCWFMYISIHSAKTRIYTHTANTRNNSLSVSDSHSKMFLLLFLIIITFQLPLTIDLFQYKSSPVAESNIFLFYLYSLHILPFLAIIIVSIKTDEANFIPNRIPSNTAENIPQTTPKRIPTHNNPHNTEYDSVPLSPHSPSSDSLSSVYYHLSLQTHHNLMRNYLNSRNRYLWIFCFICLILIPIFCHGISLYRCVFFVSIYCIGRLIDSYRLYRISKQASHYLQNTKQPHNIASFKL